MGYFRCDACRSIGVRIESPIATFPGNLPQTRYCAHCGRQLAPISRTKYLDLLAAGWGAGA